MLRKKSQDRTAKTAQSGQHYQDNTARTGLEDRSARISWKRQDNQDETSREGQPGQNCGKTRKVSQNSGRALTDYQICQSSGIALAEALV
jgi:hypothetical protein